VTEILDTTNANCLDIADPEIFFPNEEQEDQKHPTVRQARALCLNCPIINECRAVAMKDMEIEGIWGGLTLRERKKLKRKRPAQSAKQNHYASLKIPNKERSALAGIEAQNKLKLALEILGNEIAPQVRQIAELRIAFPELSYAQIGKMATPPVNKDITAGRLRRLVDMSLEKSKSA
jgi:WhiB family redox-sensing transcriptional regulator